jgi:hypothetical protein
MVVLMIAIAMFYLSFDKFSGAIRSKASSLINQCIEGVGWE